MKNTSNRDLKRFALHTALHQLAWAVSSVFSAVFLLRQGLSPTAIFLSFALIIGFRFVFRGAVLMSVIRIGLRRTLVIGTFLYGVQSPLITLVHGPGGALLIFCIMSALAQTFYWTCYQAMFAAVGDIDSRGRQVGWRQILVAIASVIGPAAGGFILATWGAWAAFGAAAAIEFAAIVPLLRLAEPQIARLAPRDAYPVTRRGVLLLATDGWIFNGSAWAWSMIMFQALGARYDAFGGGFAAASLAGALGGLVLGHFIDIGHGRAAAWLNAAVTAITLTIKALCGLDPVVVIAVAIGTALFGGLYVPSLMTAMYNEAKRSPCLFRFQFVAESGWDVGGSLACLLAAALCAAGAPLQLVIFIALPMVGLQARLLVGSYAARSAEPGLVPLQTGGP
jgi:hypothetical protein